jgi:hypothetical protein
MTPNASLTILSGDNQTVPRVTTTADQGTPMAFFTPLSVHLTDSSGAPLSGQQITWSSSAPEAGMAVQIDPSDTGPVVVTTDSNGVATLDGMAGSSAQVYFESGDFTVVASYGTVSATFNLHAGDVAPPALNGTIVSGNNQSVPRAGTEVDGGVAHFGPVQVKVQDAGGNPATGIQVGFWDNAPENMQVDFDDGTNVLTDSGGIATSPTFQSYYQDGSFSITAQIFNGTPVTFTETVAPSPPPPITPNASLTILSGDNQTAPLVTVVGIDTIQLAFFTPLSVHLTDSSGASLSGQQITWSSSAPDNVQIDPSGTEPVIVTTDSTGVATLDKITGSSAQVSSAQIYVEGDFTIVASYGSASATFHLHAG